MKKYVANNETCVVQRGDIFRRGDCDFYIVAMYHNKWALINLSTGGYVSVPRDINSLLEELNNPNYNWYKVAR